MSASAAPPLSRLSLNQKTVNRWSLPQAVEGCVRHGIGALGVWREPLAEFGAERARKLIDAAGLRVSSLCRGGFLTASEPAAQRAALDDNRAAIDEAATLGTDTLVMVVGGLPALGTPHSRDLAGARERVAEAVEQLAPYAGACGVRLALEPMHPVFTADRGVLATLSEALDLAERFPADQVAVVVDTFHVWWDPQVEAQIARAGRRIAGFQVCDWITPFPADALLSRGMMGDGHIDFRHLRAHVDAAGYTGDIEVEIFNADLWAADPNTVIALMKDRYLACVIDEL
ncbi:MAG TPA: sugar phosphate isomerase/epimerase family protein [Actinocrinis sp.]|jgi:sugar phosphate isomerase/epimerase